MSILIYAENWEGKFKKQIFELASYAHHIADQLSIEVHVISIGKVDQNELLKLGKYGVDKILTFQSDASEVLDNQVYTQIISTVADQVGAKIILLAHNNTGKAIAPRLSVRLKAGLVSSVVSPPSAISPLTFQKKVFSGKAIANQVVESERAVLTLSPNSFEIAENEKSVEISEIKVDGLPGASTKVLNVTKQTGQILLSDADIVVSGGRGMRSGENWGGIEELASILGAATACSRPVSDEGWRPHSEHTGQTGKIIAPNLYFAFGISGAIQHLAGVSSSKCIVAVNTDPDAPIFEVADYGIIGDAQKVLPDLIAAIKKVKA